MSDFAPKTILQTFAVVHLSHITFLYNTKVVCIQNTYRLLLTRLYDDTDRLY